MKAPTVSVIMPAYNHERFIGKAIESVLDQTFTDFELIIINDGSTDDTDRVARSYHDTRIRYFTQDNLNAFNTINRGIGLARGEYLAIINSDDLYHKQRLGFLRQSAIECQASFVTTNVRLIDESSQPITDPSNIFFQWQAKLLATYRETGSLLQTLLVGNLAVTTSNFFFRREVAEEIGVFQPLRYSHDYEYALRAVLRYPDAFLFFVDKPYLSYRVHPQNTITKNTIDVQKDGLTILLSVIPLLAAKPEGAEKDLAIRMLTQSIGGIHEFLFSQIEQLQGLRESKSWKITGPLRTLSRLLHGSH